MDLEKLYVKYKYTKTMTIEERTASHLLERWEVKHIHEFMENKEIEFHLSPEYTYSGTKYYQITLDLDLDKYHKREGAGKKEMEKDLSKIISRLSGIPFVIEFTGNGYRVVSLVVWSDLNLDQARKLAMTNKNELPSVDPISSFRKMPIARVGTHNPGRRLIIPVKKSNATDFSKYKSLSKKTPNSVMSEKEWLKLFKKHWIPERFLSSGGMKIIEKLYNVG